METVNMNYDDFINVINRATSEDFAIPGNRYVYNFIRTYPNQNVIYVIDDSSIKATQMKLSSDTISYLSNFGIFMRSDIENSLDNKLTAIANRQYVLIIDKFDSFGISNEYDMISDKTLASFDYSECMNNDDDTNDDNTNDENNTVSTTDINNEIEIDSSILVNSDELINTFIENYLPEDCMPSWYIDNRSFDNYDKVSAVLEAMRTKFPNINSIISYTDLKQAYNIKDSLLSDAQAILNKYQWFEEVDITDTVDSIHQRVNGSNNGTYKLFVDSLDEIGKRINNKSYITYYGINVDDYILCAAYLTYFYNANCAVSSNNESYYYNLIGHLFYNEETMLVEDRVNYLLHFPTFTFKRSDYTLCFVGTQSITVVGDVQLCPINSDASIDPSMTKDDVKRQLNFNFANNNIKSIFDFFDLYNTNKDSLIADERALRKLIIKFEDIIHTDKLKLLSICDIFFVEIAGQLYIGYLEHLRFKTVSTLVADVMFSSKHPEYAANPKFEITETDNVSAYIPLDIIVDGYIGVKKIQMANKLFTTDTKFIKDGQMTKGRFRVNKPLKLSGKYAIPIKEYYVSQETTTIMQGFDWTLFHELGMYSPECYAYRGKGGKILLSSLSRRKLREQSEIISAYGGYHPLLGGSLDLVEDMLRGDVDNV